MILDRFIAKWTIPDYPPQSVDSAELDLVEVLFEFKLPLDYRAEVLEFGLPHLTASLLHSIVEVDLGIAAVAEFLEPADMIKSTEDWRKLGLPSDQVAFASDAGGNLFCFNAANAQGDHLTSPVWFFDHDFEPAQVIAPSFTAWIERFCEVGFINLEGK